MIVQIDNNLIFKRDLSRRFSNQAALYQNALNQDQFLSPSLPSLSATELAHVIKANIQWPIVGHSSNRTDDVTVNRSDTAADEDIISNTALLDMDKKQIETKEIQFAISER